MEGGFLDVQCGDNRYHKNKQRTLPSVSGGGSEFADLVGSLGTKTTGDRVASVRASRCGCRRKGCSGRCHDERVQLGKVVRSNLNVNR